MEVEAVCSAGKEVAAKVEAEVRGREGQKGRADNSRRSALEVAAAAGRVEHSQCQTRPRQ